MTDKMTDRVAGMTEAEMVKMNSGSMKRLEAIWDEVAKRMDERSDGLCESSHAMAEAEEIRAMLTIVHRRMDRFAATHGNVPIARSGER